MSYFYVGSIILMVGIELDERLREHAGAAEWTIAHVARDLLSR